MKPKQLPEHFSVLESYEELQLLLETLKIDLKKTVLKGNKRAGINTRKALSYAQELLNNIQSGTLIEQKRAIEARGPHGNTHGVGLSVMLQRNKEKMEKEKNIFYVLLESLVSASDLMAKLAQLGADDMSSKDNFVIARMTEESIQKLGNICQIVVKQKRKPSYVNVKKYSNKE